MIAFISVSFVLHSPTVPTFFGGGGGRCISLPCLGSCATYKVHFPVVTNGPRGVEKKHLTQSYHVSTHIHTQNALLPSYSWRTPLLCRSVLRMGLSGLLSIIPKDRFTPSHSCVSSVTAQQAVNCRPLFVLFGHWSNYYHMRKPLKIVPVLAFCVCVKRKSENVTVHVCACEARLLDSNVCSQSGDAEMVTFPEGL